MVKLTRSKLSADGPEVKSMRWTVPLTKLALETRFKNPRILKKFATKTTDTKNNRATWEAVVNLFLERALIEGAWGEGEEGRSVTVSQFKNKLNAIRKAYRANRTRMLATGNRAVESASNDDQDVDVDQQHSRAFPELPFNYFLDQGEGVDETGRMQPTCDPLNVRPEYRRELGNELASLWPLLCDIFSSNPGLTGEAIIESGLNTSDGDERVDRGGIERFRIS
ncbi:hypothetical protein PR003_g7258 [Phytophthora rubi]|uniref:Myb/SANT-like domain-containing protein n=1 Tax=Phytophthora rubi TaxID=129364 RepID=A0A6A3MX34_9STRA|nr:hypothetical protein PR002_g7162 [Phytophthora rubi]KAE9346799.1 hypothetical protein PR003_g7258 [Phytophthora rubi]